MIFFKKYREGLKKVEAPNIFTTGFQRKNMGRYYVTRKISVILDANNELSIQVHPNDENANNKENGMEGKTECWYNPLRRRFKDCTWALCKYKGRINKFENKHWDRMLKRVKIKPGDFFYVSAGTIHSLGKGILALETQKSSDSS